MGKLEISCSCLEVKRIFSVFIIAKVKYLKSIFKGGILLLTTIVF